jgi:hypothetical protein
MDAGLVQEAGVQFIMDPTGISLRLRAESTRPLAGFAIRVNGRDITDLVVRHSRIDMAPDGRSGSLVLDRLPLFVIGFAPEDGFRVEATVRDEQGETTLATLLAGATPSRVPFVTLAAGAYSGIAAPTQAVVRDMATWEALWSQHTSNIVPPLAAPAIDFAREMVLAVVLGTRPTGGYSIRIIGVRPPLVEGGAMVVRVAENSPPPGAIVTQALTSPFHFVTIPRWDGPVRFSVLEEPVR